MEKLKSKGDVASKIHRRLNQSIVADVLDATL